MSIGVRIHLERQYPSPYIQYLMQYPHPNNEIHIFIILISTYILSNTPSVSNYKTSQEFWRVSNLKFDINYIEKYKDL